MRNPRGAASVEMAISMIVIIPLFLYALFLSDLLRYRLDQQEAVLSTPWDFTVQNYDRSPASAQQDPIHISVQHQARLMFCDHESGIDSYNQATDCDGLKHHTALVAHVCWLNGHKDQTPDDEDAGSGLTKQVTCEKPRTDVGASQDPIYAAHQRSFWPFGGMYRCSGRELVQNYLLPEMFLQKFSKEKKYKLTRHRWNTGEKSVHGNARDGKEGDTYFFEEDVFAILADTGAINTPQDVGPDQKAQPNDTGLLARTGLVFSKAGHYGLFASSATSLQNGTANLLMSNKLDDPKVPRLSIMPFPAVGSGKGRSETPPEQPIQEEQAKANYAASPWNDHEGSLHRKTYDRRADRYMGCEGDCE